MVGGAEGRVVVYCPGQSVGERLQRIVQQPHEGGVCGPGSFRFVTGGQGFGSGIPAVLESGEVAQRDRVQNAGRIHRRTWAGLRYAPSAPSSITKPTDSHKHWYIKRGQATARSFLIAARNSVIASGVKYRVGELRARSESHFVSSLYAGVGKYNFWAS